MYVCMYVYVCMCVFETKHNIKGTGKTFLMDLFYACAPEASDLKRRVHFNTFMLDVHDRIHRWGEEQKKLHGSMCE